MGPRKCSACGHTMGVTHAQYTQCPANAAKNVPASIKLCCFGKFGDIYPEGGEYSTY